LADRLDQIEAERRNILEKTRRQAEDQLEELQEEIRQLRKSLARARQPLEAVEPVQDSLEILQENVTRPSNATTGNQPTALSGVPSV